MSVAKTAKPKVLLFDLGGVIVRWVGLESLATLSDISRDEVLTRFAASDIAAAYEIGRCDDNAFIAELKQLFHLNMSDVELSHHWQNWVQPCYEGIKDALKKLRQDYSIACLSNTNALHWTHVQTHIQIDNYFDYAFASHLIHAAKPTSESYLIPVKEMGVNPSDIWFFDDTLVNVEAARNIGMTAFHVDREVGVVPNLIELNLL